LDEKTVEDEMLNVKGRRSIENGANFKDCKLVNIVNRCLITSNLSFVFSLPLISVASDTIWLLNI
jgi:hypothetical protein